MNIYTTPLAFLITMGTLALPGCKAGGRDMDSPSASKGAPSASESRRTSRPALGVQIDRAGRVAISTATISTFEPDPVARSTAKDKYNAAPATEWSSYQAPIARSLGILDALDGTCGNQLLADSGSKRYQYLAAVLADDRLWLNSASGKPSVYLGVEAEAIGAVPPGAGGCGGRSPGDDVIERSYSVLAAGILAGVDDGVAKDDGIATDTFPFLAPPTRSPGS